VVEQVNPFDNTDFDDGDVEEDDILVDSHPRDRQDLRIVPNITSVFLHPSYCLRSADIDVLLASSSTATALQWTDSVTGVELLVQFTTDQECNELWYARLY
jgi:hypothetical protein